MNLSDIYIVNGLSLVNVFVYLNLAFTSLLLLFAKETKHLRSIWVGIGIAWAIITAVTVILASVTQKIFIILLVIPIYLTLYKQFTQSQKMEEQDKQTK